MCLMVWLGSTRPLPERHLVAPRTPDPVLGYHRVETVAAGAPVRGRFSLPHMAYVGSHEGCGCGFNSDPSLFGFERMDEVTGLMDTISSDDRDEVARERGSRETLRALVTAALADGPVEVFGCWSGDEVRPAVATESVAASHFTEWLAPIGEGVLYRVTGP